MIPELRDLSYESCLLECGFTTLEARRLRGDQIEVYKNLGICSSNLKEVVEPEENKAALVRRYLQ